MSEAHARESAIQISDARFFWPGGRFGLAISDFAVKTGEAVLLLGESGSGKSTLLSLICGIAQPETGSVSVMGQNLAHLSGKKRDRFRADTFGIIFQMFNLLPYASALDNILVPLQFSPVRRTRCPEARVEALRIATALGLPPDLVVRGAASELSVGQQQRVAVARAMIGAPPIVVADEPTSALDASAQGEFLDLVFGQVRGTAATLLMVSHDERLKDRFDRVVRLDEVAERQTVNAA